MNALAAEVASPLRPEVLDGPFEGPWNLSDFLRYFDEINLPDLGRELVLEAFSNEPARLATARKKNVAGAFPSEKVGCAIQWEARSTERYFVYRCEYSGDVFLFLCQPIVFEVEYRDARGRPRTRRCTPAYFVLRADGVYLVECKTEKELQRERKRDHPRFLQESDGTWRYPALEKALEGTGIHVEVFSSRDASPQWLRNVTWFRDFVGAPRPHPELLDPVLDAVRQAGSLRLRDLIASPGATMEAIWWAVANREIWGDWRHSLLFEPHFAWLHATKAEFIKHQHINSVEPSEPDPAVLISFERGEIVHWNQAAWKVLHREHDTVQLQAQDGSDEIVRLRVCDAELFIRDGSLCAGPSDAPAVRRAKNAQRIVNAASDKDIALAEKRMEAIAYFQRNRRPLPGVARSTVDRYLRWAREGEADYGNPFIGLIRRRGRQFGTRDFSPEVIALLHEHVDGYCEDENAGTQEVAFGVFLADCKERGIRFVPSREAFRREIKKRPLERTLKARTGDRSGYSVERPVPGDAITTPPHGDRVFEVGAMDHWTVPIPIICSRTGVVLGTAVLTLLVDAYSTMPLGYYLGFDAPSRARLHAAISDCVRRWNRVPDGDVFDQANEAHSLDYRKLCLRLGVERIERPSSDPRVGARIERPFNSLKTRVIAKLSGNSISTEKLGRALSPSHQPSNRAQVTLFELRDIVEEALFDIYPDLNHQDLGCTPQAFFERSRKHSGDRAARYIAYDDTLCRLLALTPKHPTPTIDPGKGIKVQYVRYNHEAFDDCDPTRRKVPVKVDPYDPSYVWVRFEGQWLQCPIAEGREYLVGRTRQEIQILCRELVIRRTLSRGKRDDNALLLGEFHRKIQKERADPQLRKEYARAGEQVHRPAPGSDARPDLSVVSGNQSEPDASSFEPDPPRSDPPPGSLGVPRPEFTIRYEDLDGSS